VENLTHARGGASGSITLRVVDPAAIRGGETYELTFKDSLYRVATKDEVKTKSFSLRNVTRGTPLLTDDRRTASGEELPVTEGFRLALTNVEQVTLNTAKTGWNHPEVYSCGIDPVTFLSIKGTEKPSDYRVVFGDVGMGTSKDTTIGFIPLPGRTVNFKVINVTENTEIAFAFSEGDGNDGRLSINPSNTNNVDAVYFLERNPDTGKLLFTWQIVLNVRQGSRNPQSGDTLNVVLNKPFLASDVYQFRMKPMGVSVDQARNAMSDIRVVPNPYIAAETWEPRNTYTSGRGPRELHFINLPARCTIRIFNVSGALVKKLEHDTSVLNGTEIWNLLSDENFEIAYGVFAYHIDAPGIGQKTGTFAVIK
jgi:hypothetical protein